MNFLRGITTDGGKTYQPVYKPNRAERRAAEQKRKRQQRKGQRAFDRTVRPSD